MSYKFSGFIDKLKKNDSFIIFFTDFKIYFLRFQSKNYNSGLINADITKMYINSSAFNLKIIRVSKQKTKKYFHFISIRKM